MTYREAVEFLLGFTDYEKLPSFLYSPADFDLGRMRGLMARLGVGLGGRLDATNIVEPVVAVITSLSLDHTALLGTKIEDIAREKGGIIKPGATVVSAPQPPAALRVLEGRCRERGASLTLVGRDITWRGGEAGLRGQALEVVGRRGKYQLFIPLLGAHQQENAATAVAVLEALMPHFPRITRER